MKQINFVYNFSNIELTKGMMSLLNKGLNFCPTQKPHQSDILTEFAKFSRKVKWREYWANQQGSDEEDEEWVPPVSPSKKNNRPQGTSKELEGFLLGMKGGTHRN